MPHRIRPLVSISTPALALATLLATAACQPSGDELKIEIVPYQLPADGKSTARIKITLADYAGPIILSTSRGTFQDSGAERTSVTATAGQASAVLVACNGDLDPDCPGNASIVADAQGKIGFGVATIGSGARGRPDGGGGTGDGGGGNPDGGSMISLGDAFGAGHDCNLLGPGKIVAITRGDYNVDSCLQDATWNGCRFLVPLPWDGTMCPHFTVISGVASHPTRGGIYYWKTQPPTLFKYVPDDPAIRDYNVDNPEANDVVIPGPPACQTVNNVYTSVLFDLVVPERIYFGCGPQFGFTWYISDDDGATYYTLPNLDDYLSNVHFTYLLDGWAFGSHRDGSNTINNVITQETINIDFYPNNSGWMVRPFPTGFLVVDPDPFAETTMFFVDLTGRITVLGVLPRGGGTVFSRAISSRGRFYELVMPDTGGSFYVTRSFIGDTSPEVVFDPRQVGPGGAFDPTMIDSMVW